MSKSIRDYKAEMDKIPISQDFMQRTEALLKEAPSVKIERRRVVTWQRALVTAGSLAACAALVFTYMSARDKRVSEELSVIYDDTAQDSYFDEGAPFISAADESVEMVFEPEEESAVFEHIIGKTQEAAHGESPHSADAGGGFAGDSSNRPSAEETTQDRPAARTEPPQEWEVFTPFVATTAAITETLESVEEDADSQSAFAALREVNIEAVTITVAANIDIGNGENNNSAVLSREQAETFIVKIADIADSNWTTNGHAAFTDRSAFTVTVIDGKTGEKRFDITLSDRYGVEIAHFKESGYHYTVCPLSQSEYEELEASLFLLFGTQSDLEAYRALISGM